MQHSYFPPLHGINPGPLPIFRDFGIIIRQIYDSHDPGDCLVFSTAVYILQRTQHMHPMRLSFLTHNRLFTKYYYMHTMQTMTTSLPSHDRRPSMRWHQTARHRTTRPSSGQPGTRRPVPPGLVDCLEDLRLAGGGGGCSDGLGGVVLRYHLKLGEGEKEEE